ncbi:fumarylacetoacetate hydrolase family protein [Pseudomonas sp. ERMR1:02]|uniref:fumarylacetoacetate hydrolase family protein n=1 Tax=unclassified Pseudomonas TaxID=196821 RepID=UPI0035315AE3
MAGGEWRVPSALINRGSHSWHCPLIELASSVYTLYPGDVILTGTPEGVSQVNAGDLIRAGCEGIGEFTIQVL